MLLEKIRTAIQFEEVILDKNEALSIMKYRSASLRLVGRGNNYLIFCELFLRTCYTLI
jgi:hypothetical protein